MHDDVPGRHELLVALAIELELVPLQPVRGPAVALDHHGSAQHEEVDLVPLDIRVELHLRKPEPQRERVHRLLEHRVRRLLVHRPVAHHGVENRDTVTSVLPVTFERRNDCPWRHEAGDDDAFQERPHAVRIDGTEIDQDTEGVRHWDVEADRRAQVHEVARAVDDDARQRRTTSVAGHRDVHDLRRIDGAPQVSARAVRRLRPVAARPHRGEDLLLRRPRRSGHAGDAWVHGLEPVRPDRRAVSDEWSASAAMG